MNRLKQIMDRKAEIRKTLESDEKVDLVAIEKELRELDEEQKEIEKRQQLMQEAREINEGVATGANVIQTFNTNPEKRNEEGTNSLEYRNAFMDYVVKGTKIPTELRADSITKTTDIGVLVPETVLNKIVEKLEATGMILPLVTRTSVKGGLSIPNSSIKPVATWVAEGAGSDKQKKTLGTTTFSYHKLRCAVAVSLETDVMTLPAFESALTNNVVEAMVKAIEQAIINGSGIGQPKGILVEEPNADQVIEVATCDYQTLIEAESALPLEYESNAVWTMTKKTFMKFMGMLDANGQPIGRINYGINGKPERILLGRTVKLCNYIDSFTDSLAEGQSFAFLFDYKDYILNTNFQMGIKKYEDNETDDLVSKSIMIADGKVLVKESLVVLKKAPAA